MSCWTLLGLPVDADTRSIKRQYAKLLKQTRPDEDPVGFQRLREAYEQALAWHSLEQAADLEGWSIEPDAEGGVTLIERPTVVQGFSQMSLQQVEQAYQQAIEQGTAADFETALLRHCTLHTHEPEALVEWCMERFQWLTAWQRLALPEYLIEVLVEQRQASVEAQLRDALAHPERFLRLYRRYQQQPWLKSLDHHPWFNRLLARLLLDSPHWSAEIFEAVCAAQGWQSGPANRCSKHDWERLLRRHQAPQFIALQRQLAQEPPSTAQRRAARFLLGPMKFRQRRAMARRFDLDDWSACRTLSAELYASHPQISADMPGGTPFFWRDWEPHFDAWPMYLGIVLACLIGTAVNQAPAGIRLGELLGVTVFWSLLFGAGGAALDWATRRLVHPWWTLDERLSGRLLPGFSPDDPPFRLLRESVPTLIFSVALGVLLGSVAGATYLTLVIGVGLLRRRDITPGLSWERPSPWLTRIAIGVGVLLLVAGLGVAKVMSNQGSVNRNQGLQAWAERLCSRMPVDAAECNAPATDEQWYPQENRR